MIIAGVDGNKRIDLLAQKVASLILAGVKTDKILILTLNSFKKDKIISKINEIVFANSSCGYGQLNVSTFAGVAYNSILKNWTSVENLITQMGGESEIYPTLSGLDVSQYFLKKIVKETDFDDYFSKKNLLHQLLRRYKLIVENSLTDNEISLKTNILDETFATPALKVINKYKLESSRYRIFDNLKQISSFMFLLKAGKIKDFDNVEYLFADDVDEYSFLGFEFLKYMLGKAKEKFVFLDKKGCSRKGYLCGYANAYEDLKKEFNFEEKEIDCISSIADDAEKIFSNIVSEKNDKLKNLETYNFSKRLEMIEACALKINELLDKGVNINKIQIITPLIDDNLLYSLKEFLKKRKIKILSLTGNKKIVENLYVYAFITILELLNSNWGIKPNSFEIRILLNEILQIPIYNCKEFIDYYEKNGALPQLSDKKYLQYDNLVNLINDEELKRKEISEQFQVIFKSIIAPNMLANSDFEPINLLSKSIDEFEKIKIKFEKLSNIKLTAIDWLVHIKNSIVAQNPSKPAHIDENSLVVSTPQKIVDFSLESDYQLWLDTSSHEWIKEDTGTIYNAWVFQKNFDVKEFTPEINRELTLDKTARLLRKLALCAKNKILFYSSTFDVSGRENFGELPEFIEAEEENKENFKFIPRDDQQEILNYKSGKMAVPAVPGAGKTTVMLALLVELVKKGIKPQEILVLTYMESAARNFLNRYKKTTSQRRNLPQISTIHAFAFKILMENNNYAFVNLPEDFSICDDIQKTAIIKDICAYNTPQGKNIDDYAQLMLSAISKTKISQITLSELNTFSNDTTIDEFRQIYEAYLQRLKELSLLDYDDLLIYSIKLLKENPDIAKFYQEKFKVIIEDEAQDSSVIQQEFISILSEKNQNVIRCGDVNQAILGTFSNSDVQGFKNFISNNQKVEMFRSQRCAKGIYEFANKIIDESKKNPVMQDAFYDLKMQGVEGKNPISKKPINYEIFENPIDEQEMILNDIKSKLAANLTAPSFAILLRTNKQVALWSAFIEKQGLKVIARGDAYRQKKVFSFILSAIELFTNPWNNKTLAKFYKEYCNIDKLKFDKDLFNFIESNSSIILTPDFIRNNNANKDFEKFWWEAFSIVESSTLDIQEIVIYCANTYFDDIIDKSNAFLFSILIKRYINTIDYDDKFQLNYIPELLKYFKNLLSQRTLKGISLFSKEDEDVDYSGFVQIMTVHKAKGAEFDYVYMPEFTDFNYSLDFAKICEKIQKRKSPLLSKLTKISTKKEVLVSTTAKEEIDETLRLIYVAVTRAKLGLTFSYSTKNEFNRPNSCVEFIETMLVDNI